MPEFSHPGPLRLATDDASLAVEFRWHHDRFVHRLITSEGEELSSIDGPDDDVWPSSPPIQQVSRESVNEKRVILGVGSAGQSHWSLSVEIAGQPSRPALKFDWACRCKQTPVRLGSTYIAATALEIEPAPATLQELCDVDQQLFRPAVLNGPGTYQWTYTIARRD